MFVLGGGRKKWERNYKKRITKKISLESKCVNTQTRLFCKGVVYHWWQYLKRRGMSDFDSFTLSDRIHWINSKVLEALVFHNCFLKVAQFEWEGMIQIKIFFKNLIFALFYLPTHEGTYVPYILVTNNQELLVIITVNWLIWIWNSSFTGIHFNKWHEVLEK